MEQSTEDIWSTGPLFQHFKIINTHICETRNVFVSEIMKISLFLAFIRSFIGMELVQCGFNRVEHNFVSSDQT